MRKAIFDREKVKEGEEEEARENGQTEDNFWCVQICGGSRLKTADLSAAKLIFSGYVRQRRRPRRPRTEDEDKLAQFCRLFLPALTSWIPFSLLEEDRRSLHG